MTLEAIGGGNHWGFHDVRILPVERWAFEEWHVDLWVGLLPLWWDPNTPSWIWGIQKWGSHTTDSHCIICIALWLCFVLFNFVLIKAHCLIYVENSVLFSHHIIEKVIRTVSYTKCIHSHHIIQQNSVHDPKRTIKETNLLNQILWFEDISLNCHNYGKCLGFFLKLIVRSTIGTPK